MNELNSTVGVVAVAAGLLALVGGMLITILAVKLRRLRKTQKIVLAGERRDLVTHALEMQRAVEQMRDFADDLGQEFHRRLAEIDERIGRCISYAAVVHYDAYSEMGGRQSASLALLDAHRSGIVVSSILHREQARMYFKQVEGGEGRIPLSPEEEQAVEGTPDPANRDLEAK